MTHRGEDSLSTRPISWHTVTPQMAGQQAHHFTSTCQQSCCSELCACRQKGPERAVGGQCGLAFIVCTELEPVAVVVQSPKRTLALSLNLNFSLETFLSSFLLLFLVIFGSKVFLLMCSAHYHTAGDIKNTEL